MPAPKPFRLVPGYTNWASMKNRCKDKRPRKARVYRDAGVVVCERWESFDNFYDDMGPRPSPDHTLDRYPDPRGNYEPGNVRWATWEEQGNNRTNNTRIAVEGRDLTLSEWSGVTGVRQGTLGARLKAGWSPERIVSAGIDDSRRILEFRGEKKSLSEWAETLGISAGALNHRLGKVGWTLERALTEKGDARERVVEYGGESLSLTKWSEKLGIGISTLWKRLQVGWEVEKAFTEPVRGRP